MVQLVLPEIEQFKDMVKTDISDWWCLVCGVVHLIDKKADSLMQKHKMRPVQQDIDVKAMEYKPERYPFHKPNTHVQD